MPHPRWIDPAEAERLFSEVGGWKEVARVLSRGQRTPFHIESVKKAVYQARKARSAEGGGGG